MGDREPGEQRLSCPIVDDACGRRSCRPCCRARGATTMRATTWTSISRRDSGAPATLGYWPRSASMTRTMCSLATSAWAATSPPLHLVVDAGSAALRRAAALMRKASQTLFWSERVFAGRLCEAVPEAARSVWPCTVSYSVQLMQECVGVVSAQRSLVQRAGGHRFLFFRGEPPHTTQMATHSRRSEACREVRSLMCSWEA